MARSSTTARRSSLLVVLAATLVATTGATTATADGPSATNGGTHAFQALYLVTSDQRADPKARPDIRNDIAQVDSWYATQTVGGVIPRWALTASLRPKVVTVSLPRPASTYEQSTSQLDLITADLRSLGWPKPKQKLVTYVDVTSAGSGGYCGITGSDVTVIAEAACGGIYPSTNDTWPYGATYLTGHEMTHNFGAAPSCAPHSDGTGHVTDSRRDVIYNGPKPRAWRRLELDPGHDDYYDTGISGCRDIINSPYWTALPSRPDRSTS